MIFSVCVQFYVVDMCVTVVYLFQHERIIALQLYTFYNITKEKKIHWKTDSWLLLFIEFLHIKRVQFT